MSVIKKNNINNKLHKFEKLPEEDNEDTETNFINDRIQQSNNDIIII